MDESTFHNVISVLPETSDNCPIDIEANAERCFQVFADSARSNNDHDLAQRGTSGYQDKMVTIEKWAKKVARVDIRNAQGFDSRLEETVWGGAWCIPHRPVTINSFSATQDPAHRDCAASLELSELLGGLLSTLVDGVGEDVEADGLAEGSALACYVEVKGLWSAYCALTLKAMKPPIDTCSSGKHDGAMSKRHASNEHRTLPYQCQDHIPSILLLLYSLIVCKHMSAPSSLPFGSPSPDHKCCFRSPE